MPRFINSPRRDQEDRAEDFDDREEHDDDGRANGKARDHRHKPAKLSGARAASHARQYLAELTGQIPESVSGLTRSEEGWKVTLDVVELERVPRSTDVLASYEVEIDEDGELVAYHRTGRFYRNQVDER